MLRAVLLVSRWIAAAHDHWRTEVGRRRPLSAEIDVLRETLERLGSENDLLRARLRRLPHRHRPRYRPWERLRILWHASRHGLSVRAAANIFVLSPQTVVNWRRHLDDQDRLVRPKSPLNKLPDLVADLAQRMKREWPRWGTRRIAGILARLGIRASRTTVQRMLRRRRRPARSLRVSGAVRGPLDAKRPNHMWLIDFTRVGGLFRSVWVGAVVDVFSRKVVAIGVWPKEPPATFAVRLLREAVATCGAPAWVITDRGRQFRTRIFGRALRSRGIRRRFGAVGRPQAVSRIDRFFRTFKEEYARGLFLCRPLHSIERAVRLYVTWFNTERPHTALGLRTPDEVHEGRDTRATVVPLRALLTARHLENDRALPVLRLRAAA